MTKKKISLVIIHIMSLSFVFVSKVSGNTHDVEVYNPNYKIPNPSRFDSLEEVISAVASLLVPLFAITFGALLLYGAWMLLTSKGNPEKIESSKKTIITAIIGFVIAVLAPTIAGVIADLLGVEGFTFSD